MRPRPDAAGRASPAVVADRGGFTLLQAILVVALLGLAAAVVIPLATTLLSTEREERTERRLSRLEAAMIGARRDGDGKAPGMGFLGDIGRLPDSLAQLLRPATLPSYSVSREHRTGAGWRGPYYPVPLAEDTIGIRRDAFGRPLRYSAADTSPDGETWDGFVASAGRDGAFGTGDDLVVPVLRRETTAEARGSVAAPDGSPAADVPVTLVFPRDGALDDTTATTDATGEYLFTGVPFARVRVVAGEAAAGSPSPGELTYVDGTAAYTPAQGGTVEFAVRNPGDTEVVVTGWTATYDRTAFYDKIYFQTPGDAAPGKLVFDAGATWPGSGDPVAFSEPDTVPPAGGGGAVGGVSRTVVVDGPEVRVDTLHLEEDPGAGTTENTVIRIRDIRALQNGAGPPVDMSGATFTIDFSDGSTITFTVP